MSVQKQSSSIPDITWSVNGGPPQPFHTVSISSDIQGWSFTATGVGSSGSILEYDSQSQNWKEKKEPTLFDDIEEEMNGKESKPVLQDGAINDINSILSLILNTFLGRSNHLNCFFLNGVGENRTCFHFMNSLPVFRATLFKDKTSTISFSSDWQSEKKITQGWESIPDNIPESIDAKRKASSYRAKSVLVISNVKKIRVYEWGFEILNGGNAELVAVLSYAMSDKPEHYVGRQFTSIPFKTGESLPASFSTPIATWENNEEKCK